MALIAKTHRLNRLIDIDSSWGFKSARRRRTKNYFYPIAESAFVDVACWDGRAPINWLRLTVICWGEREKDEHFRDMMRGMKVSFSCRPQEVVLWTFDFISTEKLLRFKSYNYQKTFRFAVNLILSLFFSKILNYLKSTKAKIRHLPRQSTSSPTKN